MIILIPNEYLLKIKCILIINIENIEEYRIGFELIRKGATLLLFESFNHATFHIYAENREGDKHLIFDCWGTQVSFGIYGYTTMLITSIVDPLFCSSS